MGKLRNDINDNEVLEYLEDHTISNTAFHFRCSFSLLRSIKENERYKTFSGLNGLCTHCGIREKGEGKRFLCDICFQTCSNHDEFEEGY